MKQAIGDCDLNKNERTLILNPTVQIPSLCFNRFMLKVIWKSNRSQQTKVCQWNYGIRKSSLIFYNPILSYKCASNNNFYGVI